MRSLLSGLGSWPKLWTTRFCVTLVGAVGLLLFLLPGIYFFVRSMYAGSIAVAENSHGPTAIRRSFELTRGNFGPALVNSLIITGIMLLTGFTGMAVYIPMLIFLEDYEWSWMIEGLVSQIVAIGFVYVYVLLYCWYRERIAIASRFSSTAVTNHSEESLSPARSSTAERNC